MSEQHQEQAPEQTEQPVQTEQQQGPDVETRARDMGWVSQEEWKGNPETWRPAEEFVRRGEEFLPIVRSQLKKSEAKATELEARLSEMRDTLQRTERMNVVALKRQKEQIEADFASQKRKAVELGDTEAYDKADKEHKAAVQKLEKDEAEAAPKVDDVWAKVPEPRRHILKKWYDENPWFAKEGDLRSYAGAVETIIRLEMPAASDEDVLAEVRTRTEEKYPDKFGKTNGSGQRRSSVEPGSRTWGGNSGSSSAFSKLPAEAKVQADRFIKDDGLFLRKDETAETHLAQARERYAKEYLETP